MNHTKKILLYFSCFSITLNIISCIVLRTIYPAYLIWNLFLAYLPYLFSQYLQKSIDNKRPRWVQIFLGAAWLFFFPNTIYVLTDFIHLYDQIRLPVWFDIAEIFCFTWIAFMLGFFSLRTLEQIIAKKYTPRLTYAIIISIIALSNIGVYIGRDLRWNSWDIFIQPWRVAIDFFYNFTNWHSALNITGMVFVFTGLFSGIYFSLRSLEKTYLNR